MTGERHIARCTREPDMMKLALFSAVAGISLVSASPPPAEPAAPAVGAGYPPCSRTVTDRCIQLYERGVRTPANLAANRRLGPRDAELAAAAASPPALAAGRA
jgi:hypothetical protein